jgi:hypothetical protein
MLSDFGTFSSETALQLFEEALARAEKAGDVVGTVALGAAYATTLIGWGGDSADDARHSAERALSDARALRQPALIAMGLLALGEALVVSGEAERGFAMLRESCELSSKINSTWQSLHALAALAAVQAFHGDPVRAALDLHELLERFQGRDDPLDLGMGSLVGALAVFCRIGRPDLAARADGQIRFSSTAAVGVLGGYLGWYKRAVSEARAALGDQRYESLAREGATLPLETFVDEMIASLNEFLAEAREDQPQ